MGESNEVSSETVVLPRFRANEVAFLEATLAEDLAEEQVPALSFLQEDSGIAYIKKRRLVHDNYSHLLHTR